VLLRINSLSFFIYFVTLCVNKSVALHHIFLQIRSKQQPNLYIMSTQNKNDLFVIEARKLHDNKYDYSKVEFQKQLAKVIIGCPIHGEFLQEARSHLKGLGCRKCGIQSRAKKQIELSKQKFEEEASKIHNSFYDYALVDFQGMRPKVTIRCPLHGMFMQMPQKHLSGHGCNKCGEIRCGKANTKSTEVFIKEAKDVHGDRYDYSEVVYVNDSTPISLYCSIHKYVFTQLPYQHLKTQGCQKCGKEHAAKSRVETAAARFWEVAKKDNRFDFSRFVYVHSRKPSECVCNKCHGVFSISSNNYLRGKGCSWCKKKTEVKLFDAMTLLYTLRRQPAYDWCKNEETKCFFPFDFSIEESKIILELDGIQHFKEVKHFRRTPEEQRERDLYKQQCANKNGYSMIRIFQEDVFYDTFDWLKPIQDAIEKIKKEEIVQNVYVSKDDVYQGFK
jgi:hypothetical protein